jgi:hypothetical protein
VQKTEGNIGAVENKIEAETPKEDFETHTLPEDSQVPDWLK